MRTKRFLLVTAALSAAATATAACGKSPAVPDKPDAETVPLPANPKGSFYDANIEPPPPQVDAEPPTDAGTIKPPAHDAGARAVLTVPTVRPLPANPKGSHYDSGTKKPKLD